MKIYGKHIVAFCKTYSFKKLIASAWQNASEAINFLQNEYKINPVVIGGLAVQHHGWARFTEDVDLLLSQEDYQVLVNDNKIRYGQLKFKPGVQIDILVEGKDGNPNPEIIRDSNSVYPSFEGLIYLKMISGRSKDETDIIEILKSKELTDDLYRNITIILPQYFHEDFNQIWEMAKFEQEDAYQRMEKQVEEENENLR